MKVLVVLGIVLAVFSSVCLATPENNATERNSSVQSRYSKHTPDIWKLAEEMKIKEIKRALDRICPEEMESRILEIVSEFDNKTWPKYYNSKTFCNWLSTDFTSVNQPLIDLLEECVPLKSKELPTFVFSSAFHVLEYFCKSTGESILELANSCMFEVFARNSKCIMPELAKLKGTEIPSKTSICDFAASIKECYYDHVMAECTDPITQKSWTGIFEAVYYGCHLNEEINNL